MFTLAQLAAKQMLQQKSGNIINVGSIQAYQPTPGILDYASTKVLYTSSHPVWPVVMLGSLSGRPSILKQGALHRSCTP